MPKPLLRYVVGPVTQAGIRSVAISAQNMLRLYPEFDIILCTNQCEPHPTLKALGLPIIDQSPYTVSSPFPPTPGFHVHWKLSPPRFRLDAHEVIMDNDIIIDCRIDELDAFLEQEHACLIYQGLHRLFGQFHDLVDGDLRVNSGIIGLPPQYDFQSELSATARLAKIQAWSDPFDEQGLVAATLSKRPYIMIPMTRVPIVEESSAGEGWNRHLGKCGTHFVHLNLHEDHAGFRQYETSRILL